MCHVGDGGDVEHVDQRIADGLAIHGAGVGADGAREILGVGRIDERGLDAHARKAYAQLADGAAIQRAGRHDVVAVFQNGQQRRHLRGHAAGAGHCGAAILQAGDAFFKHRHGGVADAAVDVAEGLQVEQAGRVLGVVEDKAGGLINGRGARAGYGVGLRARMNGARAEAELAVAGGVGRIGHINKRADQ
ncbi:hypothetical protein SDC9_182173 [bioreactor metagenome]|uniref:Uncharacterized protein n=1 Tax=bioreactor metagenome TaxID=1076179 RepID=A0A645H996_9ZZZZ